MSFVTRNGNQYSLDDQRFRVNGINTYNLFNNGTLLSRAVLEAHFAKCQANNINVVRSFCHDRDPNAGNVTGNLQYITDTTMSFREAFFAQADLVLDCARLYGIKLSIVMCNQYPEFSHSGHKQSYARWNNTINGTSYDAYNYGDDFYLSTAIKTRFKAVLAAFLQRTNTVNGRTWSNDDTIFRIELINEGRFTTGTDTNSNTSSSYHLTSFGNWIDEMSTYIKSIDSNHLVSTGSESQYSDYVNGDPIHNGSYYGNDFQIHHAYDNIDDGDFHMYAYNDSPIFILRAYGQSLNNAAVSVGLTSSGTTVTATKTNHGLVTGDAVYVTDCNETAYNGTFKITVTGPNTFRYIADSTPSATPATGSPRYSKVSLAALKAQFTEFRDDSKTVNNKPVIIGEWGIDKRNTRTDFFPAYPRSEHAQQLYKILYDELDYDGVIWWHGATADVLDDNNYNIRLDGAHTGSNANNNANDDESPMLLQIKYSLGNDPVKNLGLTSNRDESRREDLIPNPYN